MAGTAGEPGADFAGMSLTMAAPEVLGVGRNGTAVCLDDSKELLGIAENGGPAKLLIIDLSAQGAHHGLLILARNPGTGNFSKTDVEMGAVFGSHVALALALERIHRLREQVVVFSDRDRIARDLHDLVIQRLFAAGLSVQSLRRFTTSESALNRIDSVTEELDTSIRDLRNTIYSLQASTHEREPLSGRILQSIQAGAKSLPYAPHLTLAGPVDSLNDEAMIKHLLAVLTESLSNAARHSGAQSINISVAVQEGRLTLEVVDDGCGFKDPAPGNGLTNMARRAAEMNGTYNVASAPGKGTSLTWSVPLA